MKKGRFIAFSLLLVFAFSAAVLAEESPYKDGSYIGFVANDHGDVIVEVVIEGGSIVDVNMLNPFKLDYKYEPGRQAF